jgi:hypothetical protein
MEKYTSPHAKLGFYVNDVRKRFSDGNYETDSADEIAVLDIMPEVTRIDAEVVGGDEVKTDVPVAVKSEVKPQGKAQPHAKK